MTTEQNWCGVRRVWELVNGKPNVATALEVVIATAKSYRWVRAMCALEKGGVCRTPIHAQISKPFRDGALLAMDRREAIGLQDNVSSK